MAARNIDIVFGGLADAIRRRDPERIAEFLSPDLVWEGLELGLRCDGRRDEVVQAAIDAGLSKSEVHRLTGIARTTIDRIVGALPAMEQDPR